MKQPATPRQGDTNRQNKMVNGKWKMEFTQSLPRPPHAVRLLLLSLS